MDGVGSMDFADGPCNCNKKSLVNGSCSFEGKCRAHMVVYEAKCTICDMVYIGNTQNSLKTRMSQHFQDVRKLVRLDQSSDSFADHFAQHFEPGRDDVTAGKVREICQSRVLWQGNAISCMKSFGTRECKLCMKERLTILKSMKENQFGTINSNRELYGPCRHITRFHRYMKNGQSRTDDGGSSRKGHRQKSRSGMPARVAHAGLSNLDVCRVIS